MVHRSTCIQEHALHFTVLHITKNNLQLHNFFDKVNYFFDCSLYENVLIFLNKLHQDPTD